MSSINCVSFRGNGSESTGSIAHRNNPTPCPTCGQPVSFRGHDQFGKKKNNTGLIIAGTAFLAAATVVGMGYAHKVEVFNKMKDGKIKDFISKLKPACEKCYQWCSTAKTKTSECWGKVKNFFSSNKS